jgi:hypothetical protein
VRTLIYHIWWVFLRTALSTEFKDLSKEARGSSPDIPIIQKHIENLRNSLEETRRKLIESEVESLRA